MREYEPKELHKPVFSSADSSADSCADLQSNLLNLHSEIFCILNIDYPLVIE